MDEITTFTMHIPVKELDALRRYREGQAVKKPLSHIIRDAIHEKIERESE